MASQMVRLNTIATNLANAGSMAGSPEEAFRAIRPVFESKYAAQFEKTGLSTMDTQEIVTLNREPERTFMPDHPKADGNGFVYLAAGRAARGNGRYDGCQPAIPEQYRSRHHNARIDDAHNQYGQIEQRNWN